MTRGQCAKSSYLKTSSEHDRKHVVAIATTIRRRGLRYWYSTHDPCAKTEVRLKISKHKMLSFSITKEIIKSNNSLVVITLFKVGENEFL